MAQRWPNVVLTGFMGTGKSTVGRSLAAKLCYEFVDTDVEIESRHGPIPEIFKLEGEHAFREYERELARDLAERDGCVISTGGGFMLDENNRAVLAVDSYVFCLSASVDTILDRVGRTASRPLLADGDPRATVERLLSERRAAYGEFTQIDTEGQTPNEIADSIIEQLAPGSRCEPEASTAEQTDGATSS